MDNEYVSAEEAAQMLGVSVTTLYAYVSRKRVRSQQLPGSRQHRYWRADVERLCKPQRKPVPVVGELRRESEITLLTDRGPFLPRPKRDRAGAQRFVRGGRRPALGRGRAGRLYVGRPTGERHLLRSGPVAGRSGGRRPGGRALPVPGTGQSSRFRPVAAGHGANGRRRPALADGDHPATGRGFSRADPPPVRSCAEADAGAHGPGASAAHRGGRSRL